MNLGVNSSSPVTACRLGLDVGQGWEDEGMELTQAQVAIIADALSYMMDYPAAGATTPEQAAGVLRKIDPEHPALP